MTTLLRCVRASPVLAALIALVATACLYDPGQRCGPAMKYEEASNTCVCDNAIPAAGGCQPCAPDEVVVNGTCGCAAGMSKNAANVCIAVSGLGDACDTTSSPCNSAMYSYCATRGSPTVGTCTRTCGTNNDCDSAYTCATWETQPYCRTFENFGAMCSSSSDCQDGDAKFCDTFVSHRCAVQGCSLTKNDCPRGTMCCDFSGYGLGTLCAGACL
ncbi:MAG TPA: hypothetical protein VGD37_03520 [Kofleriaceae bacterium]